MAGEASRGPWPGWLERAAAVAFAAGLWLFGVARVFHDLRSSGLDRVLGDHGDPRLLVFLNEHWLRVLRDGVPFASPAMFHPVTGTLGYSDGLLLYAPFFVPLRLLGADVLLAYQLTLIALTALGFAAFFWLAWRPLGVAAPLAAVAAFVFAFPPILMHYMHWSQNLAFHFVPAIALLAVEAVRAVSAGRGRRGVGLAAGAGLLLGLLFLTAFYTAWFLCVFLAVFAAVCGASGANRRELWRLLARRGRLAGRAALAGASAFAAGLAPFLLVYLPVARDKVGFAYEDGVAGLHDAAQRVARGDWDGTLIEVLNGGATPEVTWLLLAGVAWHGLCRLRGRPETSPGFRLAISLTLAVFLVSACMVRFGTSSLWWALWQVVPGAAAVRDPARMDLVTNAMAAAAFALLLQHALERARGRALPRGLAVAATGLLAWHVFDGQLGPRPWSPGLSRSEHSAQMASVPPPPSGCRSFFVEGALPETRLDNTYMLYMMDAMLIGAHVRLPTLNGYSAWVPEGWHLGHPRENPRYAEHVAAWVERHGLSGVCAFDLAARTWREAPRGLPATTR